MSLKPLRIAVVMDPFMGLGSTAVACTRLGLHCIGAEIDEGYLKGAIDLIEATKRERLPERGAARMRKADLRATAGVAKSKRRAEP